MQRTFKDDLKAALAVLAGVMLGYLVFAPDDPAILLGTFIGLTLMIVVLNVVRRAVQRRRTT
jgi:hypothetical protein